jgi:hypothetical protein
MTMRNNLHLLSGTAIAVCFLFGTNAIAQTMSSNDFSMSKTRIEAEYKISKKSCAVLAGNAKDICIAEIKGKEAVAMAELNHRYKPTLDTRYKVHVAKGEAVYEVAKQKCDDMSGKPKDVCMKEAKAALTSAKTDATVQLKTSEANAKASSSNKDVRSDAAADKRAAELKIAEEKCEALGSTAKDTCLATAKAKFGKL